MVTLKKQTVSGVKWLIGSSFLQKGIQMAATIVLARILGPSEFGLFAIAFIAIDALGIFKSMGFDSALIQRKDKVEKAANTAFFIIPVLGIVLYFILSISAPWIAKFLNNQNLIGIIRALGIIFVISCLGKVPAALLERNMRFARVTVIEVSTAVVYSVSAVTFALLKFGVWSLVIAYILKTINQNVLIFIFSGWRPKLEFDKQIAKEMFHFGKYLFLGGVVWFLKMNLDHVLVGKLLGVTALGLYAIAFNIANFGTDYFGGRVSRVVFPAFSKIQHDKHDLKRAFMKTTKFISIFAFPFCVALYLLSGELIKILYGSKWVAAIPAVKILAFAGLFNTLPIAMNPLFNATGNSRAGFLFNFIQVCLFFVFIIPAAKLYGIIGVSIVVVLSQVVVILLYLPFTMKIASINVKDLYINLKPSLIACFIMAIGIVFIKSILLFYRFENHYYYSFAFVSVFAILIYGFSLVKIEKSLLGEIKEYVF